MVFVLDLNILNHILAENRISALKINLLPRLLPDLVICSRMKLAPDLVRTTVAIFDDVRNFCVARCGLGGSDIPKPRGAPENVCLLFAPVLESGRPMEMLELLEAALDFNVALAPLVVGFLDAAFAE